MKGFFRNIDDLGRVCLPKEMRRSIGIADGDLLRIEMTKDGFLITPVTARCVVCGTAKDLLEVDGIGVCRGCADKISAANRRED